MSSSPARLPAFRFRTRLVEGDGEPGPAAVRLGRLRDAPTGREFVCLDERLSAAEAREGFRVLP